MKEDKTYKLLLEMASQGEFENLSLMPEKSKARVQFRWWCRKTDKAYHPKSCDTLWDALVDVVTQAREDREPWVTEEVVKKTEERMGEKIYIPKIPE